MACYLLDLGVLAFLLLLLHKALCKGSPYLCFLFSCLCLAPPGILPTHNRHLGTSLGDIRSGVDIESERFLKDFIPHRRTWGSRHGRREDSIAGDIRIEEGIVVIGNDILPYAGDDVVLRTDVGSSSVDGRPPGCQLKSACRN